MTKHVELSGLLKHYESRLRALFLTFRPCEVNLKEARKAEQRILSFVDELTKRLEVSERISKERMDMIVSMYAEIESLRKNLQEAEQVNVAHIYNVPFDASKVKPGDTLRQKGSSMLVTYIGPMGKAFQKVHLVAAGPMRYGLHETDLYMRCEIYDCDPFKSNK